MAPQVMESEVVARALLLLVEAHLGGRTAIPLDSLAVAAHLLCRQEPSALISYLRAEKMETKNGANEDTSKVNLWGNALSKCGYLLMVTAEDYWAEHAIHRPELAASADAPMFRVGASTAWQEASPADLPPLPPPGRHLDASSSAASMLGREEGEEEK
uniref:Uncharacterized protein n=1 Tax=Oryza rufipogon TaxID=4529 RepID=A0A0E0QHP9_ORYRU